MSLVTPVHSSRTVDLQDFKRGCGPSSKAVPSGENSRSGRKASSQLIPPEIARNSLKLMLGDWLESRATWAVPQRLYQVGRKFSYLVP